MSAPVIFYMFLNAIAPLVIADNVITTLIFDSTVTGVYSGASGGELFIKKSSDAKKIFLKGKGLPLKTNMNIETSSGELYAFLIIRGENPHSIIQIRNGKKSERVKIVKKSKDYLIEEGEQFLRVVNKRKGYLTVNTVKYPPQAIVELPKGPSLFINSKRVYK